MGYDLEAIFDIKQDDIESFVIARSIDRNKWSYCNPIIKYFIEKYIHPEDRTYFIVDNMYYCWDKDLKIHKIISRYSTNFIRYDKRFSDPYYKVLLEKSKGMTFPMVLTNMNWLINKPSDALEAAKAIDEFFPEDENLQGFKEWLLKTAPYTTLYTLSD